MAVLANPGGDADFDGLRIGAGSSIAKTVSFTPWTLSWEGLRADWSCCGSMKWLSSPTAWPTRSWGECVQTFSELL